MALVAGVAKLAAAVALIPLLSRAVADGHSAHWFLSGGGGEGAFLGRWWRAWRVAVGWWGAAVGAAAVVDFGVFWVMGFLAVWEVGMGFWFFWRVWRGAGS